MTKNTFIIICSFCLLFGQSQKYYTYSLASSNPICTKLLKRLKLQDQGELERLDVIIIGDQNKIKDGDIFNFIFSRPIDELGKPNLSFEVDVKGDKTRWLPITRGYKPSNFGNNIDRKIILDEKDILTEPNITLDLTYYNKAKRVQIHGDQDSDISNSLKKNEKKILNQPKYIRSNLSLTSNYYTKQDIEAGGEEITLRDIDLDGEKSTVLRTNLDMTRYFYVSDDSLFTQGVDVIDLKNINAGIKTYKVWQTKSADKIPTELEINGISHGDMRSLEIISHVDSEAFEKTLSYWDDPNLRLFKNIYEFKKDKKLIRANYFSKIFKNQKNDSWALVDKKHDDKFLYLLDQEYKFEKNEDEEDILVPLEDGGKTTVKTLGDIRSIWVPVITSIIVFAGFIN